MTVQPTVPVVALWDWLPAAFDPVLILVAVWLGWRADQFGKILIAAIAASRGLRRCGRMP